MGKCRVGTYLQFTSPHSQTKHKCLQLVGSLTIYILYIYIYTLWYIYIYTDNKKQLQWACGRGPVPRRAGGPACTTAMFVHMFHVDRINGLVGGGRGVTLYTPSTCSVILCALGFKSVIKHTNNIQLHSTRGATCIIIFVLLPTMHVIPKCVEFRMKWL